MSYSEIKEEHRAVIVREKHRRALLAATCRDLFLQHNPEVLEIGCGHGHFLAAYAAAHPKQFCVGIDLNNKRLQKSDKKREKRELNNLHFLKAEAREFIEALDPNVRLNRIFILFPDPWPKKRHTKRRLIKPDFVKLIGQKLAPGGRIYLATDFEVYAMEMLEYFNSEPLFQNQGPGSGFLETREDLPKTKYEKNFINAGHKIYYLEFTRLGIATPTN